MEVDYEWIPPSCSKCKSFGHMDTQCSTKEVWLPKTTEKCLGSSYNSQTSMGTEGNKQQEKAGDSMRRNGSNVNNTEQNVREGTEINNSIDNTHASQVHSNESNDSESGAEVGREEHNRAKLDPRENSVEVAEHEEQPKTPQGLTDPNPTMGMVMNSKTDTLTRGQQNNNQFSSMQNEEEMKKGTSNTTEMLTPAFPLLQDNPE